MIYKSFFKRLLDIIISFIGIIVASPIFIVVAPAIAIDSKGPIIFRQKRIGKGKKPFVIYKFRTMRNDSPHMMPTHMLENPEKHITKVGRILRKTSLDELPQLFNIFMGNMSIVGPRPVIPEDASLIEERDKYGANDIKPGLTGWAQINGRDILNDAEKARYDGEYIKKCSFSFDTYCFFKTVICVLRKDGLMEGNKAREPEINVPSTDEVKTAHEEVQLRQ